MTISASEAKVPVEHADRFFIGGQWVTPSSDSKINVIDSHTGGEPTRLVLEGGPDLGEGPLEQRVQRFRSEFDDYRCAIVNEPRGSDPLVGALLVEPDRADCDFGVIYFNNVGYLGMCGHGTIGLIASLKFAGRLAPGAFKIDTPVGAVDVQDPKVESAETIAARIRQNTWLAPEQTIVTASCGFNHLPRQVAYGKMRAMTAAKRILGG